MTTILSSLGDFDITAAPEDGGDGLWLTPDDATTATGWSLRPEGLCRGDVCVPVPSASGDRAADFVADVKVNMAAFWDHLGMPSAHSKDSDVWALGEGADNRTTSLQSLDAPDFSLPDLDGTLHSLSQHRGKKVLLATWASW